MRKNKNLNFEILRNFKICTSSIPAEIKGDWARINNFLFLKNMNHKLSNAPSRMCLWQKDVKKSTFENFPKLQNLKNYDFWKKKFKIFFKNIIFCIFWEFSNWLISVTNNSNDMRDSAFESPWCIFSKNKKISILP